MKFDNLSNRVIGCAIEVYRESGTLFFNLLRELSALRG